MRPAHNTVNGRASTPSEDAVLFIYLNYVHNTYRTFRVGVIAEQIWTDTLESCATLMAGLQRTQVEALLSRGYERRFQDLVLARYDALNGRRAVLLQEIAVTPESAHIRDFSYFSERIPSCQLLIGASQPGRDDRVHNSDYQPDERCIGLGVAALSRAALDILS